MTLLLPRSPVRKRHPPPLRFLAALLVALAVPGAQSVGAEVSAADTPADSTLILSVRRELNAGRWAAAESLALVLRHRAEARTPTDTLLLARALDQHVASRLGAGRSDGADLLSAARRALALRERCLGPTHTDLAVSLIRLAELLNARGDCAAAIPLAERGVAQRETLLGPEALAVARGLTILGMAHLRCGALEDARRVFERSTVIRERVLGRDASEVAVSLNNLGNTLQNLGRLEEAQAMLSRALEIRRATLDPGHPYIATTLGNLGNIALLRGQYAEARRLNLEALAIRERAAGPGSAEAALSYINLGIVALHSGHYDESIAWNEKALDAREQALGPDHPDVAHALDNFGGIMVRIGDYPEAIRLLDRALEIRRAATGSDPTALAWGLMNLALARSGAGQHADAVAAARESLRLIRGRRDLAPLDRAQFEEGLAYALGRKGELLSSRNHWRTSLRLREAALAPDNPDIARVCAELADVERRLGHMVTADRLLRRALEIYRRAGGALPGRPDAQQKRALLLFQKGDVRGALALALEAGPAEREKLRAIARSMPERQALRFAATRLPGRDLMMTMAAAQAAPARVAWDQVIAERSLVLDEMAERLRLVNRHGDAALDSLRRAQAEAGAWLAHLLTTDDVPDPPERLSADVAAARLRYEAAERALARAMLGGRTVAAEAPTVASLESARPPGSAVVAFVRYAEVPSRGTLPEPGPARYLAFVLPPGPEEPRVVPLGGAAEIDALVAAWREELARGALRADRSETASLAACRGAGLALRHAVWDPVRSRLTGAGRIVIVPEGALHLVPFGAFPSDDGGFLVEDSAVLQMATTERDLLTDAEPPTGRGLFAVGGAAFDSLGAADPAVDTAPAAGTGDVASPVAGGFRGSRCPDFRDLRFTPLAGSLAEVSELARGWRATRPGRAGEPILALTGRAASEESVKRHAPGHRVVHLATHGFYLETECGPAPAGSRGIGGLVPARPESATQPRVVAPPVAPPPLDQNPLRLSGVALAGANLRGAAGTEREDGILTAEELAILDLGGVEWAVLSACDSGVGAVGEGEGVFGLRRALQIAGARTVILALWAVRDDVTGPWMTALYEARFARGLDTAAACREATLRVLAARRLAGAPLHPFYWGGFLASGGWR